MNERVSQLVKSFMRALLYAGVTAAIFGLGSFTTYYYMTEVVPPPAPISGVVNLASGKPAGVDFSIFWDAWRVIQNQYVGRKDLDYQKMVWGAAKGLVGSLGDPYSAFLPPEDYKEFTIAVTGKFEGIGIEIGFRKGILTVIAPIEGTPAQRAGLKAGDHILAINKESTGGLSLDEAVSRIRGQKGTTVTLSILRNGWDQAQDFEITRDVINIKSVTWEPIDGDIAHLKIYNFNEKVFSEFRDKAQEILSSGRTRVIVDLRNDPGGYLDASIHVAGWFLKKGAVVVQQNEGEGPYVCKTCTAEGNAAFLNHKVVVLVNGGSASAAEILAGALRDNRAIPLIGEKTFGKGSVQELKELRGNAAVKVTIAKWLTPSGVVIADKGLEPDFEVKNDPENGTDAQLEKAKEILRAP